MDREGFVPLTERDALLSGLRIPRARVLGQYHVRDWHRLRDEVLEQHDAAAEGLIFKPPAEGLRVKYVTPSINVVDIVGDAPLLAELPGEFFSNRIVRLCMSLAELKLDGDVARLEAELGHGLISGFLGTLKEILAGGTVAKTFRVRVHSEEAADRVMAHMQHASSTIQVRESDRRRVGDYVYLTFLKTFQHSTAKLKGLLDGQIIID
jgi:putative ATP-dependent DNA ligase